MIARLKLTTALADGAPVVLTQCSGGYDHTTWSAPMNGRICLLGTSEFYSMDDTPSVVVMSPKPSYLTWCSTS